MTQTAAVILAAGQGKRMHSNLPKVAHLAAGKPLVVHVIEAAHAAGSTRNVVIVGKGAEVVQACALDAASRIGANVEFAFQTQQLGTGHAAMQASEALANFDGNVFVLAGDAPLIRPQTLRDLAVAREEANAAMSMLIMCPPDPTGYGRIIRNESGAVEAIVEQKDGTPEQLAINECNSGIYCYDAKALFGHLPLIESNNAQSEYYLTDLVDIFRKKGLGIVGYVASDYTEALGVNSPEQLAEVEAILQQR